MRPPVLMVCQRFVPRHRSGAPLQALHLSRALLRLGHEVSVVTTEPGLSVPGRDVVDGVPVRRLPILTGAAERASAFAAMASYVALRAPSGVVVHAHAASAASLGALAAARARGLPCLIKPSRAGADAELQRLESSFAAPFLRRILGAAHRVLVLDDDIEREVLAMGVDPARLQPFDNGVDLGRFRLASTTEREEARQALGLSGARLVVFAGQLVERKGVHELLAAWPRAQARWPDATLLFVGEGPLEREVRAAAARDETVRFLGAVDDVAPLLRAADLLVLPSRSESFGNVLVEAWASGVPVAATRVGLLARHRAPAGGLTPIEAVAPDAISGALTAALGAPLDDERRAALRAAARRFDLDAVAQGLSRLYETLRGASA